MPAIDVVRLNQSMVFLPRAPLAYVQFLDRPRRRGRASAPVSPRRRSRRPEVENQTVRAWPPWSCRRDGCQPLWCPLARLFMPGGCCPAACRFRRDPPRLVPGEQLGRRAPARLLLEVKRQRLWVVPSGFWIGGFEH